MMTRPSTNTPLEQQRVPEIDLEQQSTLPMSVAQAEPQQAQEIGLEQQSTLPMSMAQVEAEQQAAQGTGLEQQSTLRMSVVQAEIEQQTTLPMALEQQNLEQTLPSKEKPHHRSKKMLRWRMVLLLCVILTGGLLIGSVLTGHGAIGTWFSPASTHNAVPGLTTQAHLHSVLVPVTHSPSIASTAHNFMDAMMQKDWANMWWMLAPDAQQLWQGENDFIHFEQAKFGALKFVAYTDTPAQIQLPWRDPDTTQVYSEAATLQVSLEATAPAGLLTEPSDLALSEGLFSNTLFAMIQGQGVWYVLVAGPADLDAPILVPASPPAVKLLVPIFMYHHVSHLPTSNVLDYSLTVTTDDFIAQLSWLQQQGYHSIDQTELFDALYYGKVLPAHPMILSFDDGYEDVYTDALPALLAHHFRGVFYIITGMIGGRYMTWDQVRMLAQDGMQVSSHTIHHVNVGQPPAWTSTQDELLLSKEALEAQLGQPVQFFCYPTGEPFVHDPVYERRIVLTDLFNDGYVGATLDPTAFDSAVQDAQVPYQLPRIRVSGGESLDAYIGTLNVTLQIGAQRLAYGH